MLLSLVPGVAPAQVPPASQVQPPAGVPVREVEEIGTMEIFAQAMRLAGLLMNQAKSEMPGR